MSLRTAGAVCVLALALPLAAGCGANDDDDDTPTASPTGEATARPTDEPSVTPPASTTPGDTFEGTTEPTQVERPALPAPALLVDVRTGEQPEGYDRIVFEFDTAVPSYRVEYVVPPIQTCGPGVDADIEGTAMLSVLVRQTNAHDEAGDPSIPTSELTPGFPAIVEAEQTCDFEGMVEWGVGVTDELPYRVVELTSPPRLVVDILHP